MDISKMTSGDCIREFQGKDVKLTSYPDPNVPSPSDDQTELVARRNFVCGSERCAGHINRMTDFWQDRGTTNKQSSL